MIDFHDIPEWWPICPNSNCPLADQCLRHAAYLQVPPSVTSWSCVLPTAVKDGQCPFFEQYEKVTMARGFNKLYDQLHGRDNHHDVRMALTALFGSKGSYYRYKNGEKALTPQQQEAVLDIFSNRGIEGELRFDEYDLVYNFTRFSQ